MWLYAGNEFDWLKLIRDILVFMKWNFECFLHWMRFSALAGEQGKEFKSDKDENIGNLCWIVKKTLDFVYWMLTECELDLKHESFIPSTKKSGYMRRWIMFSCFEELYDCKHSFVYIILNYFFEDSYLENKMNYLKSNNKLTLEFNKFIKISTIKKINL